MDCVEVRNLAGNGINADIALHVLMFYNYYRTKLIVMCAVYRLALELIRLLIKLQRMLKLAITSAIWSDTSQYARDLVR